VAPPVFTSRRLDVITVNDGIVAFGSGARLDDAMATSYVPAEYAVKLTIETFWPQPLNL
jgi:hypothetical protein